MADLLDYFNCPLADIFSVLINANGGVDIDGIGFFCSATQLVMCVCALFVFTFVSTPHCSLRRVTKSSSTTSSTRWRTYSVTAFCLYGLPTTYATKSTKVVSGGHGSPLLSSPNSLRRRQSRGFWIGWRYGTSWLHTRKVKQLYYDQQL